MFGNVPQFLVPPAMEDENKTPDVALPFKDSNRMDEPLPKKKKVTIARLLGSEKYAVYLDCVPGTTSFEIAGVGETENNYPSREEITQMVSDFEAAAAAAAASRMDNEDFDADDEGTEKENMRTVTDTALRLLEQDSFGQMKKSSVKLAKMLELTKMSLRKKRKKSLAFVQPKIRKPSNKV